ncbi:MAG: hypothetical protein J2P41_20080 [Blastocatellia bacterium]|nr:hypothetical protein [Blastocatellia bacterium]
MLFSKNRVAQIASASTSGQGLRKQRCLAAQAALPLTFVSLRLNGK